jgi:hypothetical protein
MSFRSLPLWRLLAVTVTLLAGCGGGDFWPDQPSALFDLGNAQPAQHAGRLVSQDVTVISNEWRAPDGFSAEPYCLVRFRDLVHGDGTRYTATVAFRAADRRVLAVTLSHTPTGWNVSLFNPGDTEAAIDLPRRTVLLRDARSTQGGQAGWRATVSGSGSFPAATQSAACG